MKKLAFLSAVFITLCSFAFTGYNVGDKAMDFKLKNVDGEMVSMSDYPNAKGFIVIFTCNHCPFAKAYEDRIIALDARYAPKGYPVIAINPNDPTAIAEDDYATMQQRAKAKNYQFPYLVDNTQNIAHTYGATRTPHVFVLQKSGSDFIVKYIGAIDDNSDDASAVKEKYVENAVESLLAGTPVNPTSTKAIGCGIKWKS
ncbi:MAG TPA: thioredoxin family protein [Bacteroidia bacterium]|jgi:peroxiredoxin|nr:thioredoxin family protein [Bacteroidia bacterium]